MNTNVDIRKGGVGPRWTKLWQPFVYRNWLQSSTQIKRKLLKEAEEFGESAQADSLEFRAGR